MGNRAVITTEENFNNNGIGIYLHWNGGYDSVYPFLEYAKLRRLRSGGYGWARLCQIIGNYFGGTLSIGVDRICKLDCDNGDNGIYLIDDNFNIVGRKYYEGMEQNIYPFKDMLLSIDKAQPEDDRIEDYINGIPINENTNLSIGDTIVFLDSLDSRCRTSKIYGFDKDGNAYINYFTKNNPMNNPNNYIDINGNFRLLRSKILL
mgnify:CR=1 FL=1